MGKLCRKPLLVNDKARAGVNRFYLGCVMSKDGDGSIVIKKGIWSISKTHQNVEVKGYKCIEKNKNVQ